MRLGHPGVRAHADDALLLWSAARTRSRAIDARFLTRQWWCGGGPARERSLGSVSDTRGGVMSELLLDAAGPPSLTRHAAGLPRGPAAAQQGNALPRRPTHDRGDRDRDAPRWRPRARAPAARADRRAVARRAADLRGARARRGRPGSAPRLAAGAARQGRPPPRGRHGRLGLGGSSRPGSRRASSSRSDRCSASSTARRRDDRGRPPPHAASCAASPARPACGDALRHTNCATRTPSRWPARACR